MEEVESQKDLESEFGERDETLAGFYHSDELAMSADEMASLTPILNSLQDDAFRYREIEKIAVGGEKRITLAHDHRLDRMVAMARAVRDESREDLEQFLREARLTANLSHPNIMPVYNMGLDQDERPFFSMELIPGDSLKAIVSGLKKGEARYRNEYPLEKLLDIFIKVCDAIAYAHSRRVLHLDIKPDNIRVGEFGEVLVCDWGLARVMNADDESEWDEDACELDADVLNDMTLSGMMKGTPGFMAPEQAELDGEKSERTDIYALGALLYMLLVHQLPVDGKSASEVVKNTRAGKVIPLRRRGDRLVPKGLAAVVMKALSFAPENRYQEVVSLSQEIRRFLSGHPTHAERAGPVIRISLLLQRHSRVASVFIFSLMLLAIIISVNLVAISREKAQAVAARERAEKHFRLYKKEQQVSQALGEGLGEAVSYTVRSRDFVNAGSMIQLLETGLKENIDTVQRKNLYEQKGILHFVLQEFNEANDCFSEAGGKTHRIGNMYNLSLKYARIKPIDKRRMTDRQLADLFNESKAPTKLTLFYLYYHHMRRRPSRSKPKDYVPLAGAVLDKLNGTRYSQKNPLKLTKRETGYHLDLSGAPYTMFSINIIGVYRRNVLASFKLNSLDISNTKIERLSELWPIRVPVLRMANTPIENRSKGGFIPYVDRLKLEHLELDFDAFPEETITALGGLVELVDSGAASKK